ncbi:MAG: hypothetical protein IT159_07880 [Bryobacterales bacterium]|nr:hypothetical protein [Bryobacterales bacterium]
MIECVQKEDVTPLCPHCGEPVRELWCRQVAAFFGRRYIYLCPRCRKVLGVSHRKGFWMG